MFLLLFSWNSNRKVAVLRCLKTNSKLIAVGCLCCSSFMAKNLPGKNMSLACINKPRQKVLMIRCVTGMLLQNPTKIVAFSFSCSRFASENLSHLLMGFKEMGLSFFCHRVSNRDIQ